MASAVAFLQWDNYREGLEAPALFSGDQLTYNSRQERLHQLDEGDRLWLVSRSPTNQQYFFVACLHVTGKSQNLPESREGKSFGEFAVIADRHRSLDLGFRFPAEGLLRAFEIETERPVRHGASIGQSLQTMRFLNTDDEEVLDAAFQRTVVSSQAVDGPCSLWTKCDGVFADYFLKNWKERKEALAFLLYDPPPALENGAPVFIHADKAIRLIATFREGQYVAGYKPTVAEAERIAKRERIWRTYREETVDPPLKSDFDAFWESQHGIRGLFVMEGLIED